MAHFSSGLAPLEGDLPRAVRGLLLPGVRILVSRPTPQTRLLPLPPIRNKSGRVG